MYWFTRYLFDYLLYMFIVSFQFTFFVIIGNVPAFTQNSIFIPIILYILYGNIMTLLSYCFSFLFKTSKEAYQWVGSIVGLSMSILYLVITILLKNELPKYIHYILCFYPLYSLYYALSTLGNAIRDESPLDITFFLNISENGYERDLTITFIIIIIEIILFISIIFALEFYEHWKKRSENLIEDSIQNTDENHFEKDDDQDPVLEVKNLSKRFKTFSGMTDCFNSKYKKVIESINLSIPKGECLGILGPNGAGKTTLINIISGRIGSSSGSVKINSHDIFENPSKAYENLSICAQEDRLWDNLTGYDHIKIYCLIRGVDINTTSDIIDRFNLTDHINMKVSEYSLGTKRKLSVALAFIGKPTVVLLDEPSAGMDTTMRRTLWNEISEFQKDHLIILTTHLMEEADALCSKIGIIVNGNLKCFGSVPFLKNKFGGGYLIQIHSTIEDTNNIEKWINEAFSEIKIVNILGGFISFEVPVKNNKLSKLFKLLQDNKEKYKIDDFSVSQTTLEQVFLNFAKDQIEE